jgi:hypothetical protein
MIRQLLSGFFRPNVLATGFSGQIFPVPAGIVADNFALYGMFGFMAAASVLVPTDLVIVAVGTGTNVTLTGAQMSSGVLNLTGSPSAGFTITTPTAAQIIAAMGPNVPQDGSASFFGFLQNDGTGQTGTLTAGDANVTIVNTATVANNANRHFLLNANALTGKVVIVTLGGHAI